jgi:NADPH:quinone reductase-like Zn-dependent oxidoreductase
VSITGLALAKATGFTTIITSSSDEKLEHVKAKYGVKYTTNYKSPKSVSEAQKIPGGQGVDYILENGGSYQAIARGNCFRSCYFSHRLSLV